MSCCRHRLFGLLGVVLLLSVGPAHAASDTDVRLAASETIVVTANLLLAQYGSLPAPYRKLLEPSAVEIAKIRRPAMIVLIAGAPERALLRSLGRKSRVNLPPAVASLLETQVDGTGDFDTVDHVHVFDGQGSMDEEGFGTLTVAGEAFWNPSIYGRRLTQRSKEGLPVHGVALEGRFAWSQEPFRLLDSLELIEHKVPQGSIGIFSGGQLLILPTQGDVAKLRDRLIESESFAGPELLTPTGDEALDAILDSLWTNGVKRVLWVPVDYDEAPGSQWTRSADTDARIEHAREWIEAISRGRTTIEVTYFPGILRLAPEAFAANSRNPGGIQGETYRALVAYDAANGATGLWLPRRWDRVVMIADDVLMGPDGAVRRGAFTNDARFMTFYGIIPPLFLQHELGHTYLFGHDWYRDPTTPDPTGPSVVATMPWSYMGQNVGDNRAHPGSAYKREAYWLSSDEWADASAGGTYRLVAHDNGPAGFLRTLRIRTDDARVYWVDMRRLWPEVPQLHSGVQVYYTDAVRPDGFIGDLNYVGSTATIHAFTSPIQVGETVEDAARGVRIRVLGAGEDPFIAGALYADVSVERF
jgi:hypothetical protein